MHMILIPIIMYVLFQTYIFFLYHYPIINFDQYIKTQTSSRNSIFSIIKTFIFFCNLEIVVILPNDDI